MFETRVILLGVVMCFAASFFAADAAQPLAPVAMNAVLGGEWFAECTQTTCADFYKSCPDEHYVFVGGNCSTMGCVDQCDGANVRYTCTFALDGCTTSNPATCGNGRSGVCVYQMKLGWLGDPYCKLLFGCNPAGGSPVPCQGINLPTGCQ
jgi:hypothetical protein